VPQYDGRPLGYVPLSPILKLLCVDCPKGWGLEGERKEKIAGVVHVAA